MDIQRYLLIGASAALTIMLLGEWTSFKEQLKADESRDRIEVTQSVEPTTGLPTDTKAIGGGDVPSVSVATDEDPKPTVNSTNHYVSVSTDTIEAVIDLNGGDIVEVGLPKFPDSLKEPDVPFVILERNETRTYVAQSGIVGPNGIDTKKRARYLTAQTRYEQQGNNPVAVELTLADGSQGIAVTKTYTFTPGSYLIEMTYSVTNNGTARWQGIPFAQLKRDNTVAPNADTSGMGMKPFLGVAMTTNEERFSKHTFDDLAEDPIKEQVNGGWVAIMQHYFISAWVPNPNQTHSYTSRRTSNGFNIAGFTSPAVNVDPGMTQTFGAKLYVGPKDQYKLAEISEHLDLTVDYGWLWWLAQPLFWLLTKIHGFVQNWGVSIILLTVLVKGAFFKLSAASYRSMAKMRKVQPKLQALREEHANDKQKQSAAMMELYKKEKINPMGGCLPILIQMPVFISLYWVLMESVELRQAPFALWIQDLSVMDPYFVLPLMMGASMFFMQKLNPPPPDPMQAKIMQYLPVVFTFFFLWFPAGLVLYWVVNNLLSMAQQFVITRAIERESH